MLCSRTDDGEDGDDDGDVDDDEAIGGAPEADDETSLRPILTGGRSFPFTPWITIGSPKTLPRMQTRRSFIAFWVRVPVLSLRMY